MPTTADGTHYKTRLKALLEFFRRSRDKWKRKCQSAKANLKTARNSIRWLESSRDQWKQKHQQLQGEVEQLRQEQKTGDR